MSDEGQGQEPAQDAGEIKPFANLQEAADAISGSKMFEGLYPEDDPVLKPAKAEGEGEGEGTAEGQTETIAEGAGTAEGQAEGAGTAEGQAEGAGTAEGQAEGEIVSSLTGIAEVLEMDAEDLLATITHTLGEGDDATEISLADIVARYRPEVDFDTATQELADSRQSFDTAQRTRMEDYTKHANILSRMLNSQEEQIVAALESPEMVTLKGTDIAEFNARIVEGRYQIDNIRQLRQQAAKDYEKITADNQNEFFQSQSRILQAEVPGWGEEKLQVAVDELKGIGMNEREIMNSIDSRVVKAALTMKSMRTENATLKAEIKTLRAANAAAKAAARTVKKTIPKTIEPGTGKSATARGPSKAKLAQLKGKLKTSGKVEDAASVFENMI